DRADEHQVTLALADELVCERERDRGLERAPDRDRHPVTHVPRDGVAKRGPLVFQACRCGSSFGRRLAARSFGFTRRGEAAPRSSSFVVACRCGSSFGRRLAARSFGVTRRGEAAPRSSSFAVRLALFAE